MTRLSLADLRESWLAWLGVSLAFVVTNAALALAIIVSTYGHAAGHSRILDTDGSALLGSYAVLNLVLCALVGLAVIGASTSLVVTSRRGAVARLLLAGTTPGQVTRLLTVQVAAVAVAGVVIGDLVALVAAQPVLDAISRDRELPHVPAAFSAGWLLLGNLGCVLLCALGGLRQARAASRIPPVEALRESTGGVTRREGPVRRALRVARVVLGAGVVVAMFPGFKAAAPHLKEDAVANLIQMAMLAIPLTGFALTALLPWIVGPVTRAWTGALPIRSAAWHLARHTVTAKSDRLVRSIIPVMFSVGLLFGMMSAGDTFIATLRLMHKDIQLEGTSAMSLLSLIGLSLCIAVAGAVGNLVMMSRQRSAELALDGVVGTTPRQQLLIPVFEALIVTLTATILGVAMAGASGALIAYGLGILLPQSRLSMPWGLLGWVAGSCFVVVLLATVVPVILSLREPAAKVIARLVAA